MHVIIIQSGLKKALLGKEKKNPENINEETSQDLDEKALMTIQLLLHGRSIGCIFFGENNILAVGATSESLSEEVVGISVDSKASSFSSPHA